MNPTTRQIAIVISAMFGAGLVNSIVLSEAPLIRITLTSMAAVVGFVLSARLLPHPTKS